MRSIKTLLIMGLVAALAMTALALPALAATPGKMTVVNGVPGRKIDICIGSTNEIRSGLKYGGVYKKLLTGTKKLRFRKASPGACKGILLGGKTVNFPNGSDKTVAITTKTPKVVVFNNAKLGSLAADPDGAIALRHAADLPSNQVFFRWTLWNDPFIKDGPFTPSAATPFKKTDEFTSPLYVADDVVMRVKVTRADPAAVIDQGPLVEQIKLRRYEYVFVGTQGTNAKLVPVISALSTAPTPPPTPTPTPAP